MAKGYRRRLPPWRISRAGSRSSYCFFFLAMTGSVRAGRRNLELTTEPLREDGQVVEPTASIAVGATEDDHLDTNLFADRAGALLPRPRLEGLRVLLTPVL